MAYDGHILNRFPLFIRMLPAHRMLDQPEPRPILLKLNRNRRGRGEMRLRILHCAVLMVVLATLPDPVSAAITPDNFIVWIAEV